MLIFGGYRENGEDLIYACFFVCGGSGCGLFWEYILNWWDEAGISSRTENSVFRAAVLIFANFLGIIN